MYADYDYYSNSFYCAGAPVIDDGCREMYLRKASVFLNSLFLGKKPEEPYDGRLKDACCEIADYLYTFSRREGISSESNDGYSVSFADAGSAENRAYGIAKRYLAGTGLLYRGAEQHD